MSSLGTDLGRLASGVRLTPAQRRVLAYLLAHAAEAPFLSASDLASRVGVSQPSVTRLAVVLGFDGYGSLREALRVPPSAAGQVSATDDDRHNRWAAIVADENRTLSRLRSGLLDDQGWAALGTALARSQPLVVVGLRASGYLAGYLGYLVRKVHPATIEIPAGGPDAIEAVASARDAGASVAVVICMPRYPTATVELLGVLTRLGYRILLVTDELMPAVPGVEPEWRLAVPVGSGLTFDGHPAGVVALMMVVEAVCDADPSGAEQRLERLDDIAEDAGTYWSG